MISAPAADLMRRRTCCAARRRAKPLIGSPAARYGAVRCGEADERRSRRRQSGGVRARVISARNDLRAARSAQIPTLKSSRVGSSRAHSFEPRQATRSLARWRARATSGAASGQVTVCTGEQLAHCGRGGGGGGGSQCERTCDIRDDRRRAPRAAYRAPPICKSASRDTHTHTDMIGH